jgi:hypothetical protein
MIKVIFDVVGVSGNILKLHLLTLSCRRTTCQRKRRIRRGRRWPWRHESAQESIRSSRKRKRCRLNQDTRTTERFSRCPCLRTRAMYSSFKSPYTTPTTPSDGLLINDPHACKLHGHTTWSTSARRP